MEHRAFGRSGIQVPVVGMGTWQTFDVTGDEEEDDRLAVVDAALSVGTTLFDTSPMYGESARVLARALEGRRDRAIVADKVWTSSSQEASEQVQRTLNWFGGRVDIYQIHNLVAWRSHLPMLETLKERGAVHLIGATHYDHRAFDELMTVMRTGRIQMVQVPYNAVDRRVERDVLPLAQQLGLGVLVMRPLGAGTLVERMPLPEELLPLRPFGIQTWAQALLKFVLSDPRVHAVIPATSRPARAEENGAAGSPPWFDAATREYVAELAARR